MTPERPSADTPGSEDSGHVVVAGLSRDLGLVSALAIGTGTMIAAGIFTLSGLAVGYVGSAAIVSFLLAAVVAAFTALTYCEFTSIYPFSGEGYLYARKTFPPLPRVPGGLVHPAWLLVLVRLLHCQPVKLLQRNSSGMCPWPRCRDSSSWPRSRSSTSRAPRRAAPFQIVVTVAKIALLIWFIAGGLGSLDTAAITERFSRDLPQIASTGGAGLHHLLRVLGDRGLGGRGDQPHERRSRARSSSRCWW